MAWINGRWLGEAERADALSIYDEYLREVVVPQYGDNPAEWPDDAVEKFTMWARLERVSRCRGNLLEFALEYFSESRNPGNDGNWEGFDISDISEAATFHREIADIMNEVSTVRTNDKVAVAAPRSHAKSTYLSKAFPVHEILYRLRRYVIIISETPTVSTGNMQWIRDQLKHNVKLREDFGPLLSRMDQANDKDNSEEFIAWYNDIDGRKRQLTLVQAASTGQALRGRNWNGSRPDLIICDDLEDARSGGNASTPEQRAKLSDWFSQTVMALGDPKGERTAFVVVGTTVHFDSLLMNILFKRSDFDSKVYRAIINEPINGSLWEELRQIYNNRENPERRDEADSFYEKNESKLLEGSKVLWGEVQPLYKLMKWKFDNGSKAFNTEYMNNPIDEESMVFNPQIFTYWDEVSPSKEFNHGEYVISMGVDFALGKERGDFSAVSVVAKHKENGIIYVVDSYGARVKPDEFIEEIVEITLKWEPDVIAVESVAAQEFFADVLKTELAKEGYPAHTRLKKIYSRGRKELRIEALLPSIENKALQFSRKHTLLLEQFERYGQGAHDDLPDSLEMSISASQETESIVRTIRRMNRW